MTQYPAITETRLHKALPRLQKRCYHDPRPVSLSAWQVDGEPVPLDQALQATYSPFAVGDAWGKQWDTTWIRVTGTLPTEWKSEVTMLRVRLNATGREGFTAEGLVYINGKLACALNANRDEIPVGKYWEPGEDFELWIEAAANVASCDGAAIPASDTLWYKLHQAELACADREARALLLDYEVCLEAMVELPTDGPRRAELRNALNNSLNIIEMTDDTAAARAALVSVMQKKNGDTVHALTAIGHAHIDTAWLWPLRETIRKCARTFLATLNYMDEYPEYVFCCSQAQQYDWMEVHYPEIFERICEKVKTGQWEPLGSMWVEMDCNLAGGESLIRQLVKGKAYFEEKFGYETRDAWIPDVFGYSAALPQIFKKAGIDYFVTQKISWNQINKFPHQTFYWEGIDGTQIFSHFPPADTYIGNMSAKEIAFSQSNFQGHGTSNQSLYAYGHGDGGGGPTPEMLERMRRFENFEGIPPVKPGKVLPFLEETEKTAKNLPTWVGELYLELHRGTYTTQARTKYNNRSCEFLLRDTEFMDVIASTLDPDREETAADPEHAVYDVTPAGATRYADALDRAWKLLLLNQFHDIIPGSSITWVYEDAERDYANIRELCDSVLTPCLDTLDTRINTQDMTHPFRILNTLGFAREEIVNLPGQGLQRIQVPACGYTVVDAQTETVASAIKVEELSEGGLRIVNAPLTISFDRDGRLTGLWDEAEQRELMLEDQPGNQFLLHSDIPNAWDAWDIDIFHREVQQEITDSEGLSIVEHSALQVRLRISRAFGDSQLSQEIVITAGSKRIDFETEIDWQEDHKLLKVAFPVDILSPKATYEIQYGHVERPTHFNTSWDEARFEVCAHKWADLSDNGYGVALLNDCKYGYDIHGNIMHLSLLKSSTNPDPTADRGTQRFTYALFPHADDCRKGGVIEEAYQLNVPLRINALPVQAGTLPATRSWFQVNRDGVLIESVKPAEDGNGIVLRLYESRGTRCNCTLNTALPFTHCDSTDLLERSTGSLDLSDGNVSFSLTPFEIYTLRFH
ncbi:alpha-mannosidase [Kiritimatiellota bacterium B12222]|nr:alpha-mannosidase [Kiritimatiellota bacterium B12222]